MADQAKRKWGLENAWGGWAAGTTLTVVIGAVVVIGMLDDPRIMFGVLAVCSGALAAIGALMRLVAHGQDDRKGLDGFGKALGFNAALLGLTAAALLLWAQIAYPDLPL